MWLWESVPHSLAHGILDDETYDWLEIVTAMQETHGRSIVVDERAIQRVVEVGALTGINVSATGAAGLAGLLVEEASPEGSVAVIFSGCER